MTTTWTGPVHYYKTYKQLLRSYRHIYYYKTENIVQNYLHISMHNVTIKGQIYIYNRLETYISVS